MNIYLDIETIPGQSAAVKAAIQADIDQQKAELTAPGNYKDPAKIAAYLADKRDELDAKGDELWRKTSFQGDRGEVVCIAWAVDDGPVTVSYRGLGEDEGRILLDFFATFTGGNRHRGPTFIGHNVRDFDLRFLFQRAVILGIRPSIRLPHDSRPGSDAVFDTMTAWAGWGGRISLDRLCQALGIPTKGSELDGEEIDGAKVWDYVQAGRIEAVATYCRADVERVRAVHHRMTFVEAGEWVGEEAA